MPRPSRIRRVLWWSLLASSALTLGTWCVSHAWSIGYITKGFGVSIAKGNALFIFPDSKHRVQTGWEIRRSFGGTPPGLSALKRFARTWGFELPKVLRIFGATTYVCPLYMPFLVFLTPFVYMWHRDRRRIRPGCCLRCGYDLIGNASGVCSECGEKMTPVSQAPSRQGCA